MLTIPILIKNNLPHRGSTVHLDLAEVSHYFFFFTTVLSFPLSTLLDT